MPKPIKFNVNLSLPEFDELIKLIDGDSDDYDEPMLEGIKDTLCRVRDKLKDRANA